MDDQTFYGIVTSRHLRILLNCMNVDMHLIHACFNWNHLFLIISVLKIYVYFTILITNLIIVHLIN